MNPENKVIREATTATIVTIETKASKATIVHNKTPVKNKF